MRLILNIASSYFRFLTGIAAVVLLTPFIIDSVGVERFGLWSLCLASAGALALLDMGLSTATVSRADRRRLRTGRSDHGR